MDESAHSQVISVLFRSEAAVEIFVESNQEQQCFTLPNTDSGVAILGECIAPLRDYEKPPYFCIGAEPSVDLSGPVFEELLAMPIPRFLLSKPFLSAYAERLGLHAVSAVTLLQAFREAFPGRSANAA